jgi:hypothetical protein
MLTKLILYRFNTATIVLPDVKYGDTGDLITGASVTVTFYTPDDQPVASYTNLPMSDVVDVPGSYGYAVPGTFDLPVGSYYLMFDGVTTTGDDFHQHRDLEVREL